MPIIFDLLYREYCRARLAEMRKQLLIRPEGHEVLEANCDASRPDCAADQDNSGLGELRSTKTATAVWLERIFVPAAQRRPGSRR